MNNIRNFCIIAHIDHGKSTLADRLLELTGTVSKREMKAQLLDQMDIERERGITIKLTPVTMKYKDYILNLIDTPGHVDFSYEVSRSLAAVEGAILLVDATQGIQAQTLANLYMAVDQNLEIIPAVNKIDLPNANVEATIQEIISLLGCKREEILLVSAKTGQGVEKLLEIIIEKVKPPKGDAGKPLRALIFDSNYDEYKGVVAYVRIVDGKIKKREMIKLIQTKVQEEALEAGIFTPKFKPQESLKAGEIGYIVTGLKEVEECRVGDTITGLGKGEAKNALPGYKEVKPMVFASVYPNEGEDVNDLREAIGKLKLNDAALAYEPEKSSALGLGFRCGFLGLLHLEIFQERLRREHDLDVIITVPTVEYKVYLRGRKEPQLINSPAEWPDPAQIEFAEEPIMKIDVIVPKDYMGAVMQMVQDKRGEYLNTEFLDMGRVILHYKVPLSSLLLDFYDKLKSVSSGYASMNYEFNSYKRAELVKMDLFVAEEKVEPLSIIVYKDTSFQEGKKIVAKLKETLPRQMFVIKIQAAIGGKVVAAERLSAYRKDVTAKLYGGDITRRKKLLEKQKKGKKKMMQMGKVDIPGDVFLEILKR